MKVYLYNTKVLYLPLADTSLGFQMAQNYIRIPISFLRLWRIMFIFSKIKFYFFFRGYCVLIFDPAVGYYDKNWQAMYTKVEQYLFVFPMYHERWLNLIVINAFHYGYMDDKKFNWHIY